MSSISSSQISSRDDENTDHTVYSSVPHFVILTIKATVLTLLQITQPKPEIRDPTILCFLPFCLIYFVLFIQEAKLRRRNQSRTYDFVSHASHFFGVTGANILVSLISPVFALVVAVMCVFWFLFVTYSFYTKRNKTTETAANQSDDPLVFRNSMDLWRVLKQSINKFQVATHVAARGLDIPDVEVVIIYSCPLTTEVGGQDERVKRAFNIFYTKHNETAETAANQSDDQIPHE